MKYVLVAALVTILFNPQIVKAEDANSETSEGLSLATWGMTVDFASLDEQSAAENGVGDSLIGFTFFMDKRAGYLVGGAGLTLYAMDDEESYSVRVEDQYGNESTKSATASAVGFNFEGGMSYPLNNDSVFLEVLAGFQSFSATREVGNCSDCPSEDLSLDGGMYVKPRIRLLASEDITLVAEYKMMSSEDLGSMLSFGIGGTF